MDSLNRTIRRTLLKLGRPGALTDGQLLVRYVASQDQAAFEELVRRHGPMVLRVCQRILHHQQNAEDAFQATFIVLMRKARTVKQESVASWLYGVAYRVALKAKGCASKRVAGEKSSPEMVEEAYRLPSATAELAFQELREVLDRELSRLPEKYRTSLVLCCFEGKTPEEAAQLLACQPHAVRKR